jgi:tricarballylate dehydrogenase
VRNGGKEREIACGSVVLACGGFEANPEWRTRYLGPAWDLAKVRGCRYNQGDGIRMAIEQGAQAAGNWSGCHAISWDRNAPAYGDRTIGELFSKHSFPFGIVVNAEGRRFVDEGADFYLYTYAKYGHRVLQQPGQFAWQIFDAQTKHLLHDEYRIKQITKVTADTLEDLVAKIEDVDRVQLLKTIKEYNAACGRDRTFNPTIKDGLAAAAVTPPKSNWATPIEVAPFEAYAVTCGITFTYGGIKIDGDARVLDIEDAPIPGLFSAGEMVGGIFYFNYPGGSGLTNGSVFGRIAGRNAAHFSRQDQIPRAANVRRS